MRQAPALRTGDDSGPHLADGTLFSAAIEALMLGLARAGRSLGLDRRDTQRLARGQRGLPPDDWLELAGRLDASADATSHATWTARKREVAQLIREGVAGAVPGHAAVFGPVGVPSLTPAGVPSTWGAGTPADVTADTVVARAPLVGTHEHATVERRPDGTYGWRIGAEGALSGRYRDAEDAAVALEGLIGEGCHPRARDAALTVMLVACMHFDNRRTGR